MHGPPADWTWPHGAPRPTTFPARSAKPHELLRAQLTHPEPPAVDDDVPSFPTRSTPLRREDGGVVDPGFIRDRSGRKRRRPVLPTGPVHSGPASPVTATCPPSASRQPRPRRRLAIARHQLGDCDRIPGPRCRQRPPLRTRRNSGPSWWPAAASHALTLETVSAPRYNTAPRPS